ncbi:cyclin A [Lycorma delicatula]|uniref:cyclin A n=1 Tax=Lycorma delicatula TaxID=130591 RepID=UPI003F519368
MASFQVHEDQENQVTRNVRNLRSSKPTISNNNRNGGRNVLGIINNNSRLPVKLSKNEAKPTENGGATKESKNSMFFTIHHDKILETKVEAQNKNSQFSICQDEENGGLTENCKKVSSTITRKHVLHDTNVSTGTNAETSNIKTLFIDDKVDISSDSVTDVYQNRLPLKELKLIDEEEPMSEGSFFETSESSPMVIDRSLIITPSTPETKPPSQRAVSPNLYDMEEYRKEIYLYLREAESRHRPKPCYMLRQPDITYSMRTVLVEWLVEVAEEYKLHTETLYLAVSFIDRFLSVMSVIRGKLQLLGTAAMFIASKYEEIYPPEVSEFVYITDETYNKKQVLRMEHLILKVLKFDISVPTPLAFLTHLTVECKLTEKTLHLAMYLCELSLLEGDPYLQYLPSLVACAAIATARHRLGYAESWTDDLIHASGYSLDELAPCICDFNDTHSKAETLPQKAVWEKYKTNKWHNVSEIPHSQFVIASSS